MAYVTQPNLDLPMDQVPPFDPLKQSILYLRMLFQEGFGKRRAFLFPIQDLERTRPENFPPLPEGELIEGLQALATFGGLGLSRILSDKSAELLQREARVGPGDVNQS